MNESQNRVSFPEYLKSRGVDAGELAEVLGVTKGYCYQILRGLRPGWKVAKQIEVWSAERFGQDQRFDLSQWGT